MGSQVNGADWIPDSGATHGKPLVFSRVEKLLIPTWSGEKFHQPSRQRTGDLKNSRDDWMYPNVPPMGNPYNISPIYITWVFYG